MIYLSIGSNQGNRLSNLKNAVIKLVQNGFEILEESIILETTAILPQNAPKSWDKPYLNMIVAGKSNLSPIELLKILQLIEVECGRDCSHEVWSPRIIDLDILLWYDDFINLPNLQIPHKELLSRPFLLHLLAMMDCKHICKESKHPYFGMNFNQIAHQNPDIDNSFSKSFVLNPKMVGIVNITNDSFSDGGAYINSSAAIKKALALSEEGATIIELGGQSTRPNALMVGAKEEWGRLEPVLQGLNEYIKTGYNLTISIDSFLPEVIDKAIKSFNISWINDVKCCLEDETLRLIADQGCGIVVMHSLDIPPNKNNIINFDVPAIDTILIWAEAMVTRLMSCGFEKSKIILDPGIGFGKSAYQNFSLMRMIAKMRIFGCEILVGHSRKSYINAFNKSQPQERLLETLAISQKLYDFGVDYLRVHDIEQHQRFFVAAKILS